MTAAKAKASREAGPQPLVRRLLAVGERPALTRKIDWALFALMCLSVLVLNVVLYRHSGAFWRDETSSIFLASVPTLKEMWNRLAVDSAPAMFYGSLRLWIAAGAGGSDEGLRLFGILVSLGIVASLSVSCWLLTARLPLLATALVALNVSVFYYCSSLRSYGLAVLFIMPCCAAFWRLCRQPSRWNILASLLLAILSCHTSYQNSYLLLAIGLGGAGTARPRGFGNAASWF